MSQRPVILMMTPMHESGMGILRAAGDLRMATSLEPGPLREEIREADALVLRTAGVVDAALLDAAPKLQVVGRHGVGYDHVDVPAATERGIYVVTTPGANTGAVAEHAIAFMIGLSKHFTQQGIALREGRYDDRVKLVGKELVGRTLGIVGFGRIGRRGRRDSVPGLRHEGALQRHHRARPRRPRSGPDRRVGVELDELLRESEYVTLRSTGPAHPEADRGLATGEDAARRDPGEYLPRAGGRRAGRGRRGSTPASSGGTPPTCSTSNRRPPITRVIGRPDVLLTPHSARRAESLVNMSSWVAEDVVGILRGSRPGIR
ncbi:MAG: NAD(P)-dependent oxidoreductase [Isosphaeraceae bacterium]